MSDNVSFSLAKNVLQLQRKLSRTEKSIDDLTNMAQRYFSDENSVLSGHHLDETCSLPPPLTLDELMLETSFASNTSSTFSKDKLGFNQSKARRQKKTASIINSTKTTKSFSDHALSSLPSKDNDFDLERNSEVLSEYTLHSCSSEDQHEPEIFEPLSEHMLSSNVSSNHQKSSQQFPLFNSSSKYDINMSNKFFVLQPDSNATSLQLTSSPRKSFSQCMTKTKFSNSSIQSVSSVERPRSSCSYQDFKTRFLPANSCGSGGYKKDRKPTNTSSNSLPLVSGLPADNNDDRKSQYCHNESIDSEDFVLDSSPQRPISARSNATSVTLTASDNKDAEHLKQKLVVIRSENARLRTLVSQLRDQLEKYSEMASFPQALSLNEEQLTERIMCLVDQIKANEKTLRNTEEQLEYKDKMAAEKDHVISSLKSRLVNAKKEVENYNSQKLRAETSREEAVREANLLSMRLKESYSMMADKLEESQGLARKEVARAASEHNNTLRKYETVKLENETLSGKLRELQKKVRALENESRLQDVDAAKMMDQAQQRIRELVAELDEKHSSLKKLNLELNDANEKKKELHEEVTDLKQQNRLQRERLQSSQQENEFSKSEIDNLKKSLSQVKQNQAESSRHVQFSSQDDANNPLSISPRKHHSTVSELNMQIATKEAHIKRLETRLSNQSSDAEKLENLAEELLVVGEKARASDRRANELEDVVHLMESERTKYLRKVNDLQDELHDKIAECESLEKRLKERTTTLNESQRNGDDLKDKVTYLETQVEKKKEEVSSLQKQIEEQVGNEQQLKAKLSHIQAELNDKIRSLESAIEDKNQQELTYRRETKKVKKLHAEQCDELMEQADTLQQECMKQRNQLSTSKQQLMTMNDQLKDRLNYIHQLEGDLTLIRNEEKYRIQTHEEALKVLEDKLSSSSKTIQSLENALSQCKAELAGFIDRHNETHSNFKHQMAMKTDQVAKLETDLKLAQSSLHDECGRAVELETALESRQKMLEDAASRIADLEESQTSLQSQVAKLEQQLSSEGAKAKRLIFEMEEKLDVACRELDTKKRQYTELNGALKKVDEDFNKCKVELMTVETQLEELSEENDSKTRELERSEFEWKEMKTDLDAKIERVAELEAETQKITREEEKLREKVLELETEATQLRAQNQDAMYHNDELKSYSQHRNADILNKEMNIAQLQEALKLSKSECETAKATSTELKKSLEERQWQLQQRAAQMSQLDQQVRDFRRGVEKRNHELEDELERVQKQLNERNSQVSHLDDQITSMRSDVAEVRRLLADEQHNVKRLERDLIQKEDRVEELTQTVEAERKSREERHRACIETSQEVRLAREREQKIGRNFQDVQRELARIQREHNRLLSDINEMSDTAREKDERIDRLTSQLNTVTSEKLTIESKYRDELDRTQADAMKLKQEFENESENIISANNQLRAHLKIATGNQAEELASALEREKEARVEATRAKETLVSLERELVARKQVIEAGNDTIVIKDAEIARLQAKLAGLERVSIMASLPNTPVKLLSANKENIPLSDPARKNLAPPSKPNRSDTTNKPQWTMEDSTPSSLFTVADSEIGSLAPSFVPIAASTKRCPEVARKEESSFFFTSSPNQTHHFSGLSTEEESLCRRVFGEAQSHDCSTDSLAQAVIGRRPANQLAPERCMADLQEKLRASEQRRKQVASKLRNLKGSAH